MLKELDDYDWREVFGDPGEYGSLGKPAPEAVPLGSPVDPSPFSREDVAEIHGIVLGENNGPDWICVGKLKDGRYFKASGGCDYTGWS